APQRGSLHDECVELNFAVAIEKTTAPGVECLVIFEYHNSFFHGIQGRPAAAQGTPSCSNGIAHSVEMVIHHLFGDCPRPAMHHKNRISCQVRPLKNRTVSLASGEFASRSPRVARYSPQIYLELSSRPQRGDGRTECRDLALGRGFPTHLK